VHYERINMGKHHLISKIESLEKENLLLKNQIANEK
jgi:hypothetical protein